MDELLTKLTNFGAIGIICAVLIYNVYFLQKKVISIIENNTKALEQLKSIIEQRMARRERPDV
jgi:hypothetical protein